MRPSSIFFTHDSIKNRFRDGRLVRETLRQLQEHEIQPSVIPIMHVCRQEIPGYGNRFWAYTGNRRLWVFRELSKEGVVNEIKVLPECCPIVQILIVVLIIIIIISITIPHWGGAWSTNGWV